VPVAVGLGLGELLTRIETVLTAPHAYEFMYPTYLRLDSLAFGVLLSYWYHYYHEQVAQIVRTHRWALAAVSIAAVAPCLLLAQADPVMETIGLTLLYIGFGGWLMLAVVCPPAVPRRAAPLVTAIAWLGTFSYSVYLWHLPVLTWGPALVFHVSGWAPGRAAMLALYFAGSVIVGVGMAKLIEMPVLRLRDRWLVSRDGAFARSGRTPLAVASLNALGTRLASDSIAVRTADGT
jgi:peptidoglycan/LPS O-acetylase OafA/YrhL